MIYNRLIWLWAESTCELSWCIIWNDTFSQSEVWAVFSASVLKPVLTAGRFMMRREINWTLLWHKNRVSVPDSRAEQTPASRQWKGRWWIPIPGSQHDNEALWTSLARPLSSVFLWGQSDDELFFCSLAQHDTFSSPDGPHRDSVARPVCCWAASTGQSNITHTLGLSFTWWKPAATNVGQGFFPPRNLWISFQAYNVWHSELWRQRGEVGDQSTAEVFPPITDIISFNLLYSGHL